LPDGGDTNTKLALELVKSRQFINEFINNYDLLVPIMAAKDWDMATNTLIIDEDAYDVANKKLWGRPLWFSLHYGAMNYPSSPGKHHRKLAEGYIKGLPMMIPCDACKNHANAYITRYEEKWGLWDVTADPQSMFRFFWEFHNHVNSETGKPVISLAAAISIYKTDASRAL
jgi:hypothetical protein